MSCIAVMWLHNQTYFASGHLGQCRNGAVLCHASVPSWAHQLSLTTLIIRSGSQFHEFLPQLCYMCRKVLQERNSNSSDNSFYFRIYLLVLGVYAALRLFLAMLLKFPACHSLSEMSDQSFFQFFKWIYQVSYISLLILAILFSSIFLCILTCFCFVIVI